MFLKGHTEGCSGAMVTPMQMTMETTMMPMLKEQSPALLGLNQKSSTPRSAAQPAYALTCIGGEKRGHSTAPIKTKLLAVMGVPISTAPCQGVAR